MKLVDLVGKRFGKLLVVERAVRTKGHSERWLCRCDCGLERIASGENLKNSHTRSCGCLRASPRLPPGEAAFRMLLKHYKSNAARASRVFTLTDSEVRELTKGLCFYCGAAPSQTITNVGTVTSSYIYNGIDRVDNALGYERGNTVSCCMRCNIAKAEMSVEDFKAHIKHMYAFWASK